MQQTMPTPVGVREIAGRAGVTEIAVRKWIERHSADGATPFPRPVGPVSGRDAYWWHQVVDWLAATGRLVEVTRLAHPDTPLGGYAEWYVTIGYDVPNRHWILAEHDDTTAIRSWDQPVERPGRPWMYRDEDNLVAEIRQRLLAGWRIASRQD